MLPENLGQKYGSPMADALHCDQDQDFSKGFSLSTAADFSKSSRADAEQGHHEWVIWKDRCCTCWICECSKERQGNASLGGCLKTVVQCGRLQSAAEVREIF